MQYLLDPSSNVVYDLRPKTCTHGTGTNAIEILMRCGQHDAGWNLLFSILAANITLYKKTIGG